MPHTRQAEPRAESASLTIFEVTGFVVLLWVIFLSAGLFSRLTGLDFNELGIAPRSLWGLWGVLFAPLLHGSFWHILANTVPLFFLLLLLLLQSSARSLIALALIWLVGGLGTWLIGRGDSIHIGASGLIFGLITYLIAAGWWRRNLRSVAIALVVIVLYAPMLWGILPGQEWVSWEAHLCGASAGVLAAWLVNAPLPFSSALPTVALPKETASTRPATAGGKRQPRARKASRPSKSPEPKKPAAQKARKTKKSTGGAKAGANRGTKASKTGKPGSSAKAKASLSGKRTASGRRKAVGTSGVASSSREKGKTASKPKPTPRKVSAPRKPKPGE